MLMSTAGLPSDDDFLRIVIRVPSFNTAMHPFFDPSLYGISIILSYPALMRLKTFSKQFVETKKANEASEGEHFGNITPEGVADPSSPDASGESLSNSAAEGQGGETSGSWS